MTNAAIVAGLTAALERSKRMIEYYGKDQDTKRAQNAALEAAGLALMHRPDQIDWNLRCRQEYEAEAMAIEAALSHFTAMEPAEAAP